MVLAGVTFTNADTLGCVVEHLKECVWLYCTVMFIPTESMLELNEERSRHFG